MFNIFSRQLTKRDLALDKFIAILVLCVAIAFIAWSISLKQYGVTLPGVLLVSSLLYLLLRKRLSAGAGTLQLRLGNRIGSLSHIIFVISLSLSIWLLWSSLYYRPPIYFILCLVAVASIILDIFGLDETKSSRTSVVLFKIIALSITIYAGIYYQFPGIYGVDPWGHTELIRETINLGHIAPGQFLDNASGQFLENSYFLFPMFHFAAAISQIVTGLSIYNSIFTTVGVPVAISCLFVFLIGRKLVDTRVGLLAALIVPLSADAIERATTIIPMSLGFCFFLAILYFAFCRDRKRVSDSLLVILLSVALILTHPIAALVTLLAMVAVFVGIKVHKQISKSIMPHQVVSATLIALFGVAMLTRWMQAPPGAPAFFDRSFAHLVDSLRLGTQFVLTAPPTATNVSYPVSLLNQGGYLLLLAFAIIGALICLHPKNRTASRTALASTAAVLIAVPYSFMLFSLENILPARWFLFLYVPLSILAICGLSSMSNLIKGNIGKVGMVILMMLAVIFMTITNSMANDDSPQVFNGATRYGYTQAEITAIETLSDMGCGCPETDIYYGTIFPYVIGYDAYADMVEGDNALFIHRNYYLHHPEWNQWYMERIHKGGIGSWEPERVLISDYMKEHAIDTGPLIYSNRNVKVYAITSAQ